MSITIHEEMKGNKYKVTFHGFGGGMKGYSKTYREDELVNVVKHYFGMKHNKKKCPNCKDKYGLI